MKKGPIAALLMLLLALPGCGKKNDMPKPVSVSPSITMPAESIMDTPMPDNIPDETQSSSKSRNYAEGRELLALVNDEQEAKKIAEIYGIELVRFRNGVATFHTEENPVDVINRGKENGWPLLELNHKKQKQ